MQSDFLTDDLRVLILFSVLAIAKRKHKESGDVSGEFPCPVCRSGTVRWAIAQSNGHTRAVCNRQCPDGSSCVSAME